MKIVYKPIGIIHTPYKKEAPPQPFYSEAEGIVEIYEKYKEGLIGLEKFNHIVLIYHFHLSKDYKLLIKPRLNNGLRGIFATCSPNRPNGIGVSVVKLQKIEGAKLYVKNVDILDGTPLLDIKPHLEKIK
jgi:tRNA-Thr(GGU) m(6)t(6)A37 methyltransferase TsaA